MLASAEIQEIARNQRQIGEKLTTLHSNIFKFYKCENIYMQTCVLYAKTFIHSKCEIQVTGFYQFYLFYHILPILFCMIGG
jgi:hypothetical protein